MLAADEWLLSRLWRCACIRWRSGEDIRTGLNCVLVTWFTILVRHTILHAAKKEDSRPGDHLFIRIGTSNGRMGYSLSNPNWTRC